MLRGICCASRVFSVEICRGLSCVRALLGVYLPAGAGGAPGGAPAGFAHATGGLCVSEAQSVCSDPRAERSTTVRFTLRSQSSMTARIFVESVEVTQLTYLSGEVTSLSSCQWANSRPSPKRLFRDM